VTGVPGSDAAGEHADVHRRWPGGGATLPRAMFSSLTLALILLAQVHLSLLPVTTSGPLVLFACIPHGGVGGSASQEPRSPRGIYVRAVNGHVAGAFEPERDEVANLSDAERRSVRADFATMDKSFLRRAALMHADALVAYADMEGATVHLLRHHEMAAEIVTVLAVQHRDRAFAGAWWYAVGGRLTISAPLVALDVLHQGLKVLGDETRLRFAAGSVEEALASPRVQDAMAASAASPVDVWGELSNEWPSPRVRLNRAADELGRALKREPHPPDAHLRLGRVLVLLGDLPRAREQLQRARAEAPDDTFVTYHASMFLGDLDERVGQFDRAEAEYRKAASVAPLAQAPRTALSHLLRASGRVREALDLVSTFLAISPPGSLGDEQEPWLSYGLGAGRTSDRVMSALKAEAER
jgi:tetratricopeptide (TPR) repeat protein